MKTLTLLSMLLILGIGVLHFSAETQAKQASEKSTTFEQVPVQAPVPVPVFATQYAEVVPRTYPASKRVKYVAGSRFSSRVKRVLSTVALIQRQEKRFA